MAELAPLIVGLQAADDFVMKELDIRGSHNAMLDYFEAVIAHLESGPLPNDAELPRPFTW